MVNEVLRRRNRSGPGFAPSGVEKADGYAGAMHRLRSEAAGTGGELALIERIRRASSRRTTGRGEVRLGIGDDCAILRVRPGEEIVVTTDFSLEGRHFRRDWHSPQSVGHRVLARGLSDLAAMGARPVAAFLSLALPREAARDAGWVDGFLDGFLSLARRTGTPLAGGDTSEAPGDGVLADIVLLGAVKRGQALRRDGARAGDRLFVTGSLGGADAELEALGRGEVVPGQGRTGDHPHLFPEPRLAPGQALVRRKLAAAGMDLSDGLSTDLRHLCEASGVAAEVKAAWLPLHPLLLGRAPETAMKAALDGGEDYELLFATRPRTRVPGRIGGVKVTEIGRLVARRRGRPMVSLIDPAGRRKPRQAGGWEHLR